MRGYGERAANKVKSQTISFLHGNAWVSEAKVKLKVKEFSWGVVLPVVPHMQATPLYCAGRCYGRATAEWSRDAGGDVVQMRQCPAAGQTG